MFIPIPIPIGVQRIATVQGAVWKFVMCEQCHQSYAYLLKLEATGEAHDLLFLDAEGTAEQARVQAANNFVQKARNIVLAIPCPRCGHYQDDMARNLKQEASINPLQIAGAATVAVACIPLAFGIPYIWMVTVLGAAIGLALLAWGYARAFRFDANAGDPKPRQAFGQQYAIWGERLAELIAAGRSTSDAPEPTAKPLRQND